MLDAKIARKKRIELLIEFCDPEDKLCEGICRFHKARGYMSNKQLAVLEKRVGEKVDA
jgi:hypothetical protein